MCFGQAKVILRDAFAIHLYHFIVNHNRNRINLQQPDVLLSLRCKLVALI